MFCPECGSPIPEGAQHCPQCGTAIGTAPDAAGAGAAPTGAGAASNASGPAGTSPDIDPTVYMTSVGPSSSRNSTPAPTPSPAPGPAGASAQPVKPAALAIVGVVLLALSVIADLGSLVSGNQIWNLSALTGYNLGMLIGYYLVTIAGCACAYFGYKKAPHKALAVSSAILLALVVVISAVGISRGGVGLMSEASSEGESQSQSDYDTEVDDGSDSTATDETTTDSTTSTTTEATTPALKNYSGVEGTGNPDSEYTFNGQTNIKYGQTFDGEGFAIDFTGHEFVQELLPSNPGNGATYVQDVDDYTYLVFEGYLVNASSETITVGKGAGSLTFGNGPVAFYHKAEGGFLTGFFMCEMPDGSDIGTVDIEPGIGVRLYIVVPMPDDYAENITDSKLFFTVGESFDEGSFTGYQRNEDGSISSFGVSFNEGGVLTENSPETGDYVFCLEM